MTVAVFMAPHVLKNEYTTISNFRQVKTTDNQKFVNTSYI